MRLPILARLVLGLVCLALPTASGAQDLWDGPESVAWDSLYNRWLVSSWADGKIIAVDSAGHQECIDSTLLHALGNQIAGEVLYVSNGTGVAGFDLHTAEMIWYWAMGSAGQTDGLAADTCGYLYVVDMNNSRIFKVRIADGTSVPLVEGGLPPWTQDITYDARHHRLLVVSYAPASQAPLQAVDPETGAITNLVTTPTGYFDGICMDEEGNVYISCSTGGTIWRYDSTFTNPPEMISGGHDEPAGLAFNPRDRILAIPNFGGDRVDFLDLSLPRLIIAGCSIDDAAGDGDGHADPGESINLSVNVANPGWHAPGVSGAITTSDGYVSLTQAVSSFGDTIMHNDTVATDNAFAMKFDAGCGDPHVARLVLELTAEGGYSLTDTLDLHVGDVSGFDDDMEGGQGFWRHRPVSTGFADQWHLTTERCVSEATSWKVGGSTGSTYANRLDAALVTPPVLLTSEASLTFSHWIDAEEDADTTKAWDGAVVMISNGGGWTQLTPEGGYTHTIIENPASPLSAGTPCYSGSRDWTEVTIDLSAYSGVVQIMFRFGSDAAAGGLGWFIDDVSITGAGCCGLHTGGYTGNVNCDIEGRRNLSDITVLVNRVYIDPPPEGSYLCCEENGDVNGDGKPNPNLSDITALVDHVYITQEQTAPCQ